MIVRFVGARIGQSIESCGLGMRALPPRMIMSVAAMDQLPVLCAARMLDQKHMSTARTLENQRRQADQDANVPNHWGFREEPHRREHRRRPIMGVLVRISIRRSCGLECLTQRGYTHRRS